MYHMGVTSYLKIDVIHQCFYSRLFEYKEQTWWLPPSMQTNTLETIMRAFWNSENVAIYDMQIRLGGELQSQFPTIDILARGFASRDAAMNFASRHGDTWLKCESMQWTQQKTLQQKHTNEMVQGWFSVVTMVQGLSQQMFGNLFWNLLWPDLSRIETRIVLKLDVLAVFVQSISGSASLFIPHRNCWELLCLKAFHKISAFHGKVYQKMGLCLRCVVFIFHPRLLELGLWFWDPSVWKPVLKSHRRKRMWFFQCENTNSNWKKLEKIRQIFITYDFFLMRFPNVLEGRFSQILGNLLIYFGNPNFSGFRIATIWQIGFRCQGSD